MDKSLRLKINAKSLVAEAKIIREEERKLLSNRRGFWLEKYQDIREHRVNNVRGASRESHLVRAYLAGKSYKEVERNRKPEKEVAFRDYTIPGVLKKFKRFRIKVTEKELLDWIEE